MMANRLTDYDYALRHKYRTEHDGPFVPGVTTAIGVLDKPQLKWAAATIASRAALENTRRKRTIVHQHRAWLCAAKGRTTSAILKRTLGQEGSDTEVYLHWARGEFDRQWKAKAERGTRVHDIAERWSRGDDVDVLPEDSPYIDALEQFYRSYHPRFVEVETIVVNPTEKYGGRFDAIVELDGPESEGLFIIDYKTGGEYHDAVAMQFAGYMMSEIAVYDDDGTLVGSNPLPKLDGARTIYLHDDGTISVSHPFRMVEFDIAWTAFHACLQTYKAIEMLQHAIKTNEGDDNE
jgi:hypothetical protein